MTTDYTYSIQNDFPNHKVATDRLTLEIRESAIQAALDGINTAGDLCTVMLKANIQGDEAVLDGLVAVHSGEPLPDEIPTVQLEQQQADNVPVIATKPRLGKELIECSGNLTDPTTWYSSSTRVEDEPLTKGVDDWWYSQTSIGSGDVWIDMTHGKVFDELAHCEASPHGYAVIITADGVPQTMRAPFAVSGGDYEVDYLAGKVRPFVLGAWDGKTVLATYSKMVDSLWTLKPDAGKVIVIDKAEVQFSSDVVYTSGVDMQFWGSADYFAPGQFPPGTLIQIGHTLYSTIDQFIDEAVGSFPAIPAIGGPTRGTQTGRYVFHFYYGAARQVFSSLGMEIRIRIEGDIPFEGERCTATFYCLIKTDPGPEQALIELQG